MHTVLACLSIVIAALSWLYSVRRVREVERRLADAERAAEERHIATVRRIGEIAAATRPCRRIHAADLPAGMVRAPIPVRAWRDDEEALNPLMR